MTRIILDLPEEVFPIKYQSPAELTQAIRLAAAIERGINNVSIPS